MGASCCVAARDRTILHGSSGEINYRNHRHSPSWSFRWDNRVGIASEDTSIGWMSDVTSRTDVVEVKSTVDLSGHVSDGGSSLESYQTAAHRKSLLNSESTIIPKGPWASGHSFARSSSIEIKKSTESPQVSDQPSVRHSPSMQTSSLCVSPLSTQSNSLPPLPTPSRWASGSRGHCPSSDIHSSGRNSPMEEGHVSYGISAASNESTRDSFGSSSDGWSAQAFSELMSASQRGRWSFDSDSCSCPHDKLSRIGDQNSRSISMDLHTCGICSKLLMEKSTWGAQKIIAGTELFVVAVLICGHVYHAECLETITPEINKYDPACPICTFGEKQTLKLCRKMLKPEKKLKARHSKKARNQVLDTDGSFDFDIWKRSPLEGKIPKLSNNPSLKIYSPKPFLNRYFSFGSRGNKSAAESSSAKPKGLFWAKSSRI